MQRTFLNGRVTLHGGDALDVLRTMPDACVDSVCTDPPYGLQFMGRDWDHDSTIAFNPDFWREVLRVLKPGGHVVAFGGCRTYHRLVCAIEDAGFEIRDQLAWLFGSGFPKSHDVSKGIDKVNGEIGRLHKFTAWMRTTGLTAKQINDATGTFMGSHYLTEKSQPAIPTRALWARLRPLCGDVPGWVDELVDRIEAEREVVGKSDNGIAGGTGKHAGEVKAYGFAGEFDITAPATPAARQWQGWGTALKPAHEPIVLARKPLEDTVAGNVLKHGTGAINVDGCRVNPGEHVPGGGNGKAHNGGRYGAGETNGTRPLVEPHSFGRWPANVCHDGSDEVVGAFPESSGGAWPANGAGFGYSGGERRQRGERSEMSDSGSAARFFYSAKADADDRLGSKHPTVKPVDLMQWLVRLVTPKNGTCLDPFAGTGTTGEAAFREGCKAILIEREAEYQGCIERRMAHVLSGPDERRRVIIKAKGKVEDADPLFGGAVA